MLSGHAVAVEAVAVVNDVVQHRRLGAGLLLDPIHAALGARRAITEVRAHAKPPFQHTPAYTSPLQHTLAHINMHGHLAPGSNAILHGKKRRKNDVRYRGSIHPFKQKDGWKPLSVKDGPAQHRLAPPFGGFGNPMLHSPQLGQPGWGRLESKQHGALFQNKRAGAWSQSNNSGGNWGWRGMGGDRARAADTLAR